LAWSDGTRDLKQDLLDLEANGYHGYLSLETATSRYYEKPWVAEQTTLKAFEKLGKEEK
jgi:protein FrlC